MDVEEEKKYPNPPFKIIILDEADTVTPDAQAALRRIIVRGDRCRWGCGDSAVVDLSFTHTLICLCPQEAHSKITRFILICNYVTRVIEPLASRCAKFRFQPLPPASMKARLMSIADSEGCSNDVKDLADEILALADGDMRRAVTTLQSVHSLSVGGAHVDKSSVAEIAGLPPPKVVDELWDAFGSKSFDTMQKAVDNLIAEGYSAQLLLSGLLPKLLDDAKLNERSKADLAIRLAEAEKNMIEGADEQLQLMTIGSLAVTCFIESH